MILKINKNIIYMEYKNIYHYKILCNFLIDHYNNNLSFSNIKSPTAPIDANNEYFENSPPNIFFQFYMIY